MLLRCFFVRFFFWFMPFLVTAPEVRVICQEMPQSADVE
jgi:hypothetical protein